MTPFIALLTLWSCSAVESERWKIQLTDGEEIEATIRSADAENFLLGDGTKVHRRRAVSLERVQSSRPPWPGEPHLAFANGDRLVGTPIECDQRTVYLNTPISNSPMKVPLSRVESIWFDSPSTPDISTSRDSSKRDRATLKNGDRLSGSLSAIVKDEKLLKMEIDSKVKSIPLEQLVSLHLNSELRSDRLPEQVYWQCTLRNGSRLSLTDMRLANDRLAGRTLFRAEVAIPFGDVVALDRLQGQSVWLSSLKPARFEATPYLGETLAWQPDRNAGGTQLSLRAESGVRFFDRGLSIRSKSTLTYSLEGRYEYLLAEVGLDPKLGKHGNVDITVSLDDRAADLPNLKGLTLKRGSVPVRVKVNGVKRLTLAVDWGEGGPVGDVVNWGQARLIQK